MFLTVRICLSYVPPIWLAYGTYILKFIQSQLSFNIPLMVFVQSISFKQIWRPLLAPTKSVSLSDLKQGTDTLLPINR